MPQGKMKKKVSVPKGVKTKIKKEKPKGPKRGHALYIAPKRQTVAATDKAIAEVSKIINAKNEELAKNKADSAQGRNQKQ